MIAEKAVGMNKGATAKQEALQKNYNTQEPRLIKNYDGAALDKGVDGNLKDKEPTKAFSQQVYERAEQNQKNPSDFLDMDKAEKELLKEAREEAVKNVEEKSKHYKDNYKSVFDPLHEQGKNKGKKEDA